MASATLFCFESVLSDSRVAESTDSFGPRPATQGTRSSGWVSTHASWRANAILLSQHSLTRHAHEVLLVGALEEATLDELGRIHLATSERSS
mmetsp:Transcript_47705/g.95233  ORF Transcript_47705/g.95233 Transcript_47705/m.95233 type:complete len:92 (-) Transcript_47705:1113-1388(-)